MKTKLLFGLAALIAACQFPIAAANAESPSNEEMFAKLKALEAELAELRAQNDSTWMNERRAEEIKGLVREVLSDAETRASLLDSSLTAGHNGERFFLSSDDGSFLLMLDGQIQFRHTVNLRDDAVEAAGGGTAQDNGESGFELARTKLRFAGHIADPRLHYVVQLDVARDNNQVYGDIITIGYDLTDNLTIKVGEDVGPFLREELIDSRHQLAVERSYVNELFTTGVVQGVWLTWEATEQFVLTGSWNDGGLSGEAGGANEYLGTLLTATDTVDDAVVPGLAPTTTSKAFDNDGTDFAFTARGEYLVAGAWAQAADFASVSGDEMFLLIGGAIHWEEAETGGAGATFSDDVLSWTVDVSYENDGWNAYFAYVGADIEREDRVAAGVATAKETSPFGLIVQGGYAFDYNDDQIEPFVRYEYIDFDANPQGAAGSTGYESELSLLTLGVNWYHKRHAAKFTTDVVIAFDPVPATSGITGLIADNAVAGASPTSADEQIVWRMQYQLLF